MSVFHFNKDGYFIDDKKVKIVSGAMHYFRIFPEYWEDRLLKLKELGCNCVETYCAWNLHEKREGEWDFTGILDLKKYLELAQKLGLYIVMRPGPYICSECDLGGLPWWLLKDENMQLRCYYKPYLEKVKIYLEKICDIIRPFLITNGGNIIMVQVENEYGGVAQDRAYLEELAKYYREFGIDVPFITSDGEEEYMLLDGTFPDAIKAVNYRWNSPRAIDALKKAFPDNPPAVMELWNGQQSHWEMKRLPKRDLEEVRYSVETALENADFVNLYMFHGGTNFGFFNGSLYYGDHFAVQLTSYDVQAPLNEYGKKTKKYYLEQKEICKALGKPIVNETPEPKMTDYGEAELKGTMGLSELPSDCYYDTKSDKLLSMEQVDQAHGYIVYETKVNVGKKGCRLIFPELHDRAFLYIDGVLYKNYVRDNFFSADIDIFGEHTLTFFVENLGRAHAGRAVMHDRKGLIGEMKLYDKETEEYKVISDYNIRSYPFHKIPFTNTGYNELKNQVFYKYEIDLKPDGDTYLEVRGFIRGLVFINGFNLGRHYWNGPQKSLYVPKSLLKDGKNEIIVFDVHASSSPKKVLLHGKQILLGITDVEE